MEARIATPSMKYGRTTKVYRGTAHIRDFNNLILAALIECFRTNLVHFALTKCSQLCFNSTPQDLLSGSSSHYSSKVSKVFRRACIDQLRGPEDTKSITLPGVCCVCVHVRVCVRACVWVCVHARACTCMCVCDIC